MPLLFSSYLSFLSADSLLVQLSSSFDQKMRILLDPEYHCEDQDNAGLLEGKNVFEGGTKRALDNVKNSLLRDKVNKKVELRRGAPVHRSHEPDSRRSPCERVLRPSNKARPLKRSDSLSKKEKTEMNLSLQTMEVTKENTVMKLKEYFEEGPHTPITTRSRNSNATISNTLENNKYRKKLVDKRNNRIKRRHTVGGTKDFSVNISSDMTDNDNSKSYSERSVQIISCPHERSIEGIDERRFSLPDCQDNSTTAAKTRESHV